MKVYIMVNYLTNVHCIREELHPLYTHHRYLTAVIFSSKLYPTEAINNVETRGDNKLMNPTTRSQHCPKKCLAKTILTYIHSYSLQNNAETVNQHVTSSYTHKPVLHDTQHVRTT